MTEINFAQKIKEDLQKLNKALAKTNTALEVKQIHLQWTNKDSLLANLQNQLKTFFTSKGSFLLGKKLSKLFNEYKKTFNDLIAKRTQAVQQLAFEAKLNQSTVVANLQSKEITMGTINPLNQVKGLIMDFLRQNNFAISFGNVVDNNLFNFEKLLITKHHPAREDHDTFYLSDTISDTFALEKKLLRTHCTNCTSRALVDFSNNDDSELRYAAIGPVYRNDDDDATHSHQFTQIDAVCLASYNITLAHLKNFLLSLLTFVFETPVKLRFRISYFPFTEPSLEVDLHCIKCTGEGCLTCKQSGYIEILGAGMIHNDVLTSCGIDSNSYQGFAFGLGIERLAMIKYQISDIRSFYNNDLRFLHQF